jgi:hypothetical protein
MGIPRVVAPVFDGEKEMIAGGESLEVVFAMVQELLAQGYRPLLDNAPNQYLRL